MSILTSTTKI